MIIQFDVDGVLADFGAGYDALCLKLGLVAPGPDAPWDAKWEREVWTEIKASPYFWKELPPLIDGATFRRIHNLAADVYFVTARPGRETKWQTEEWLSSFGVKKATVIVSGKKAEFAQAVGVTYSIDDKAGNAVAIQYMSRGTKSYLLDASYNRFDQSVLGTKVKRVLSVAEFLRDVEAA